MSSRFLRLTKTAKCFLIKLHSLSYTRSVLDLISVAFLDSPFCDFYIFLYTVCPVSKLTLSGMTLEEGYIRVDTVKNIFRFSLQVARSPQCVAGLVNPKQTKKCFLVALLRFPIFSRRLRKCTKFRS